MVAFQAAYLYLPVLTHLAAVVRLAHVAHLAFLYLDPRFQNNENYARLYRRKETIIVFSLHQFNLYQYIYKWITNTNTISGISVEATKIGFPAIIQHSMVFFEGAPLVNC